MVDEVFPQYTVAKWQVGGLTFAFPVESIIESGGNRLIQRERPYRDGAKLDDTGSQAKTWELTVLFENTIEEPGLSETNGVAALYPDVLNSMVLSFDVHETGTLDVPTIGAQRARAHTYRRVEAASERDAARLVFVFVEDNEDNVDFRIIEGVTANANARRLAEQTTFDAQSIDNWDQNMANLETFVAELEDLTNAPSDTAAEVENRALRVRDLGKRAVQVFSSSGQPGRDQFLTPRGNRAERKILRERDMAGRALGDARRGRPQVVTVVFGVDLSIFDIAALLRQPVLDLIAANPTLDVFFVPRLTPVVVFATTGLNPGRTAEQTA